MQGMFITCAEIDELGPDMLANADWYEDRMPSINKPCKTPDAIALQHEDNRLFMAPRLGYGHARAVWALNRS